MLLDGARIIERQVEREGAALPMHAGELDLAAEQHRQFAADGESESGAAILAGGSGVRLLKGFEYQSLLLGRDADAGVLDRESQHLVRLAEHRVIGSPALGRARDTHLDVAMAREFHRVGQQVLENLLQALRVAGHAVRQVGREPHVERKVLGLGYVTEIAIDVFT